MNKHIETTKYIGADRRESVPSETYKIICKDRFMELNSELTKVREDTKYLISKIDNGLSSLPSKMNWLQATFITLLIAIVGGVGVWTYRLGQLEGELDTHISTTEKMIGDMLDEVRSLEVIKPSKIIIKEGE